MQLVLSEEFGLQGQSRIIYNYLTNSAFYMLRWFGAVQRHHYFWIDILSAVYIENIRKW